MTREELDRLWSNPRHWSILGYRCKQDPRVIVPKRIRWAGWTLNFAHPLAWPVLLLSIVVAVGPVLLLLVVSTPTLGRVLFSEGLSICALIIGSHWEATRPRRGDVKHNT